MKPDYKSSKPIFQNATPQIFHRAKQLRNCRSDEEIRLWEELKGRKLKGLKFRQQHPVKSYILDFYCHELKIAIELDGNYHNHPEQKEYDKERTFKLEDIGIQVIRFWNYEIKKDIESVLNKLIDFIDNLENK